MDIYKALAGLAAVVTISGGVAAVTKEGRRVYRTIWRFLTRRRPKVPRETMRIIPQSHHIWWGLGLAKGEPAMQVVCDLYISNISMSDVLLCKVSIRKPETIGHIFVRHPNRNIYGNYPIPPGCTTEARADFWIQPPICKKGEHLIVDIDFLDQFGNLHRVRKVKFRPPAKKREAIAPEMETVSDISNPIEREIVAVLQAEVYRYKGCGRKIGGLGSLQTTYRGRSYCGVGTDWRKADSPELQEIVPDAENATIESDNASTLIKFYRSLLPEQKNEFVKSLLERLSREAAYASVGYLILLVLYRIGDLNNALKSAKDKLQGDSAHGFSDFLMLLDGLLKYEYQKFTTEMLNDIEQFLKGIKEHTFRISERLVAIRVISLGKTVEKAEDPPEGN